MSKHPTDCLVFLVEYLDLPEATGDPNAKWEEYQIRFLNNRSILTSDVKSRQVGWSFIAAAEAIAYATLIPRTTVIFVSVTQVEASEKVRYANYCIDALDSEVRPKKIIDNRTEIELENGSRIISHPCRPPRGKARARVYLDEIAHYPRDEEIYTAAVPIITRGGVIRMGSSPLGASGVFWEIVTESLQPYPGYTRTYIPWWHVDHLCHDVEEAKALAPEMATPDRVAKYGTERLVAIYENMPLEDFQQEYECDWSDESIAWITWDEIKRNQVDAQLGLLTHEMVQIDDTSVIDADLAIARLKEAIIREDVENTLVGGMDIGRKKNLSEIVLVGKTEMGSYPFRMGLSMDRTEFSTQKYIVSKILNELPIETFFVDNTGLGMQLAEDLEGVYPQIVEGVSFTNQSKEEWAVNLKLKMQAGLSPIPLDRNFSYQVHSVKRMITASKKLVFDTERNEKHHADKFWALALAHAAVEGTLNFVQASNPLVGYRG